MGYKIKFPKNETANIILDTMKEDGINMDYFLSSNVKFNATGYFRKIVEKLFNVKWEMVSHDDPDEDLQCEYYNFKPHPSPNGTLYKSLRIQFSLPQSTYATMFFRELAKQSSAFSVQSQFSKDVNSQIKLTEFETKNEDLIK